MTKYGEEPSLPLPVVAQRRSVAVATCTPCLLVWCCCPLSCICFVVIAGLYALVIDVLHPWKITVDPTCVETEDAFKLVPRAPRTYPEPLQTLLWMDQGGAISTSSLGGSSDLFVGFGDSEDGKFDPATRSIYLSSHGPSTLWANNPSAYWMLMDVAGLDYGYTFIFGDDYRWAQIVPSVAPLGGWIGTWSLPTFLANFSMAMQDTEEIRTGKCPPPKNASKEEFSKCAKWVRRTTIPIAFWRKPEDYYVFEILDSEGRKVQPYYDLYVERADNETSPNASEWKNNFGLQMPENCKKPHTAMLDRSWETIHGHTPQFY